MLKKFSVEGGVVQSDYSVSSLSLSLRDKEREREKREIELDNILYLLPLCFTWKVLEVMPSFSSSSMKLTDI